MSSSLLPVDKPLPVATASESNPKEAAAASSLDPAPACSLQRLDFIASSHAVKSLFSLGVVEDQSISVAIHNVDGTLLLDYAPMAPEPPPQQVTHHVADDDTQQRSLQRAEQASQQIISFPSALQEIKDSDAALALILTNPPPPPLLPPSEGSSSEPNNSLGLPVPDDYVQRFLPPALPEPREYLPWKFNDLQLLIGSNATIYRAASNANSSAASSEVTSTAITLRVEQTRDLQSLLEQYEQNKRLALQNKPSYAQVAMKTSTSHTGKHITATISPPLPQASSNIHATMTTDEEQSLQTCIIAAPSCPVGGLLSSRGGVYSTTSAQQQNAVDTPLTSSSPVSTVLDIYLDNIMANVPQLALCLQDKGFIQSVKLLSTDDIPSTLMHPDTLETSTPFSIIPKADGDNVFSPEVMETNASMLLRFLQTNCSKNNTTYLLRREQGDTNIQLYDISTLSSRGQKRWVFWLAMMSYRFANRLRHVATNHTVDDPVIKRAWRARQRSLLHNTLELLEKLADMDGNQRESLAAAVHEHLADSMLGHEDLEGPESFVGEDETPQDVPAATATPCISMIQQPYANMSVDALSKAQDHLAKGIKALMPVLEMHVEHQKDKAAVRGDGKSEIIHAPSLWNDHAIHDPAFQRMIEPVATQLFALHYKFVNVSLRLAEVHLGNYFSSSAMQALRTSARCMADSLYLVQLLNRDSDKRVYSWLQRIQLQYTWLWEHCGHFARSFAADELWRDRGHASGDDVVSVLQDVEAAFRDHPSLNKADAFVRGRFIEPENPLTEQSKGDLDLHRLFGVVDFASPFGKRKVSHMDRATEDKEAAERLLDEQRTIIRDKRKVLIAASLAYSQSINSFRTLLAEESLDEALPSPHDTALLGLLEQRLGDACNETGKILLNELRRLLQPNTSSRNSVAASDGVAGYILSSAQFWFFRALTVFEGCKDVRNLALLRCNLCQAYKLQANSIFAAISPKPPEGQTHPEICLQEAVHHLEAAHESLGERDLDPKTWNFVSEEMAATFLVLGVRRRQSLIGSGSVPVIMQALRLSPGKEHSIVEPIERALHIYEQLGNQHQAAAAHYQLALYFSKIWTCQLNETKTREKLTLAFQHFNAAFAYFSQSIRDNEITFCLLCIDSSGLYSAVTGLESTCKALLRCLDTAKALTKEVIEDKLKALQTRADWFNQMDVIATAIDERVFKALRNLVKLEGEPNYTGIKERYKDLYRVALQAKMRPAPTIVYSGDEGIDRVANRLQALHSVLELTLTHYDSTCL